MEAKADHLHRGAHHYTGVSSSSREATCHPSSCTFLVRNRAERSPLRVVSQSGPGKLGSHRVNLRLVTLSSSSPAFQNTLPKIELNTETVSIFLLFSPKLLKLQERVLSSVVLHLLGDEDPRVRHVAAASLVRYLLTASPSIHISG